MSRPGQGTPVTGDHRAGVRTATCHDIQTPLSLWRSHRRLSLLRRLDAVAADLGVDWPDALHAALLCWLEQEERKTAGRDHMLKIRALTKTKVRTDTA